MADADLATLLEANIEYLTETWMRDVRNDNRINSDEGLSRSELRDHVPAILEDLCGLIRSGETPDHTNTPEGRVKVYVRLMQGYLGRDLAREISLLRIMLLDFLADKCSEPPFDANIKPYHFAARIINLYMDETLRNAISAYSEPVELPGTGDSQ
jgi:hypothetical protein